MSLASSQAFQREETKQNICCGGAANARRDVLALHVVHPSFPENILTSSVKPATTKQSVTVYEMDSFTEEHEHIYIYQRIYP